MATPKSKQISKKVYRPSYLDTTGDLRPSVERELVSISNALQDHQVEIDYLKTHSGGGGGGGAGVSSFKGRTGVVVPLAGDYSLAQITGSSGLARTDTTNTFLALNTFGTYPVVPTTLAGPTLDNQLVTKKYVSDVTAGITNGFATLNQTNVFTGGNTFNQYPVVPANLADPTSDVQLVTKKYVDAHIATAVNGVARLSANNTFTGATNTFNHYPVVPASLADPTLANQLVTKGYVDDGLANVTLTPIEVPTWDWQQQDLQFGKTYRTTYRTANPWNGATPPTSLPNITYSDGTGVAILVENANANGTRLSLKVFPDTTNTGNFKYYDIIVVGAKGSRVFTSRLDVHDSNSYATLNTTQTFTGQKTFNLLPHSTATAVPTLDVDFVNKKYVDSSFANNFTSGNILVAPDYVGAVEWWNGSKDETLIPEGYLPADGRTLNRVDYPELWKLIEDGVLSSVNESLWQNANNAQGALEAASNRGKYSTGNGTSTFRLPDLIGKQPGSWNHVFLSSLGAASANDTGVILGASAPNITGQFSVTVDGQFHLPIGAYNNAFTPIETANNALASIAANQYTLGSHTRGAKFSAADSNGVYGRYGSSDLQPNTAFGMWLIRVSNAKTFKGIVPTKTYVDELFEANSGISGGFVGATQWFNGPDLRAYVPDGYIFADGQVLYKDEYPELWDAVNSHHLMSTTEALWVASGVVGNAAQYRGMYSQGGLAGVTPHGWTTPATKDWFRAPDLNGALPDSSVGLFLRGKGLGTILPGSTFPNSAPNIIGQFPLVNWANVIGGPLTSGAFWASTLDQGQEVGNDPVGGNRSDVLHFDAKRGSGGNNSPYGRDTSGQVTPNNAVGYWIIQTKKITVTVNVANTTGIDRGTDDFDIIAANTNITGKLNLTGDLDVIGKATIASDLAADGITAEGITVNKDAVIGGDLQVSTATVSGAFSSGPHTITGNATISGTTTLNGAVNIPTQALTVNLRANLGSIFVNSNHSVVGNNQGLHILWNERPSDPTFVGAAAFVNNRGGGNGGFMFRNVNLANNSQTGEWDFYVGTENGLKITRNTGHTVTLRTFGAHNFEWATGIGGAPGGQQYVEFALDGGSKGVNFFDSDIKFKDQIEDVVPGKALEIIDQIRPRSYHWKHAPENTRMPFGVIAQELETVLPEAVATHSDGSKALDPLLLIGFLLTAVKDLKAEVDALKAAK